MADAGWYPDAGDPHVTRYFDGSTWTAQRAWDGTTWVATALGAVPARVVPPVAAEPPPAVAPPVTAAVEQRPPPPAAADHRPPPPAGSAPASARPPADRKRLLVAGGALAVVVVLVIVGISRFGGGGGGGLHAFCNDQRGRELAVSDLASVTTQNRDRWTSAQKDAAKQLGDSLRAAAGDAPAQVRDDSRLLVRIWTKIERGSGVSKAERLKFSAAGKRVKAFNAGNCTGS